MFQVLWFGEGAVVAAHQAEAHQHQTDGNKTYQPSGLLLQQQTLGVNGNGNVPRHAVVQGDGGCVGGTVIAGVTAQFGGVAGLYQQTVFNVIDGGAENVGVDGNVFHADLEADQVVVECGVGGLLGGQFGQSVAVVAGALVDQLLLLLIQDCVAEAEC